MDRETERDWALLESRIDQVVAEVMGTIVSVDVGGAELEEKMAAIDHMICRAMETGSFGDLRPGTIKLIAMIAEIGFHDILRRMIGTVESEDAQ